MRCRHDFSAEHTAARAQIRRIHRADLRAEAHVGDELRCGTFREQQATALDEATQRQQAIEAHTRSHVVGLVNAAKLRRFSRLLPRHWRTGH